MKNQITIMQWNIENLFIYTDLYQSQDLSLMSESEWQKISTASTKNKSLSKIFHCQAVIQNISPDIIMLNEVGGLESLSFFNKHFLNQAYEPLLVKGNSDRGIDVGYLIKKNLGYNHTLTSHKDQSIPLHYPGDDEGTKHYFSRDLCELSLFEPETNKLKLVLLLTHLKSQLDLEKIDPYGFEKRQAEVKKIIQIYKSIRKKNNAPVIVAGDFNGQAKRKDTSFEFEEIYTETDLRDAIDISNIAEKDQTTYIKISSGKKLNLRLDYIFVCERAAKILDKNQCFCYRFKDSAGNEIPLPNNLEEKFKLPSDHYPVLIGLNFNLNK